MKIVIVGAGEVGRHLCGLLSGKGHDVTLIESAEDMARKMDEEHNLQAIVGNGSSAEVLVNAKVADCDFFLAMTSDDRTNLVSTSIAKALGARTTITRIHDQTYTDTSLLNYQLHFGIDYMINPEALCGIELAKLVRNPGRLAVENFARGQIEVHQVPASGKSKILGRALKDLKIATEVRVGYIQRGGEFDVPTAESTIEEGDIVTIFGATEQLHDFKRKLDPESHSDSVRVVLFGGGEIAIALVRLLSNPRFKLRVIEAQTKVCRTLAEKFPHVTVIHGDATSLRLLEEEQVGDADFFIACTKDDEDNIVTGLQAAKLGSEHVQIVINRSDYDEVLNGLKGALGFEMMVSPRVVTANEVLRYISQEPVSELADLPGGVGRIVEIRVSHESPHAGRKLREIPWPKRCIVAALLHKYQAKVPGAEDLILAGDRVVAITREQNVPALVELLGGG